MSSTVFVDFSTPIVAAWLNTINQAVYAALGLTDAGPFTPAQVLSNINGVSQTTFSAYQTLLAGSSGGTNVGFIQPIVGAVQRTVSSKIQDASVTPQDFGATGDGVTDDSSAFTKMFATGRTWYIPYTPNGYKISVAQTITSSGSCDGLLIAAAGFTGKLISIVNPAYSIKLNIYGLNVYSTDVRPSPYGVAATTGIYVGPNATYLGNTPCPGVNLYGCRATRFSIGCWISTFNVTCFSCEFPQNDHDILIYTTDTNFNQVNDISLINCTADSAASSVGQAYALRVGTSGNGVYTPNASMGVNMLIQGCNFDGAPVYIDNILGVVYQQNYHEQGIGYSYFGAALVLGSAGAGYAQNVLVQNNWFTQFYYAIDVITAVTNLEIKPNMYASIAYSAVRVSAAETSSMRYWNGTAGGSTNWAVGSGAPEVLTNFSNGVSVNQLTFGGMSISNDYLNNGSQVAPGVAYTTNWYPYGITNDGNKNLASAFGRFRSGAAVQTSIAGTQSGTNFTFTTTAQAKLFNGGDRISGTGGAAGATFIKSINHVTGVAVLDVSAAGAATISHMSAYFVGYNLSGSGSPNGTVTANPGSIYVNLSGGAGTTTYVKESGVGTNTGWVGK